MTTHRRSSVLVTGGAGFIGSNFVRAALADLSDDIVVLDKLTYAGHLVSLEDIASDDRFSFEEADIADRDAVRAVFERHRPRAVINFAAESHVDRSIDDPGAFIETNIRGCFELLEAARGLLADLDQERASAFRFLHVSTDEVFGSLGETGAFRETTAYSPRSPYSASKASADHLVNAYHHTYGLPTLLTNCSNNYGPYQYPEKLIPLMTLNAVEGRDLPIYGNGSNVRDWLHVEDHCAAILRVLAAGAPGESYNVGGDEEHTNLEVVDTICRILDHLLPAGENDRLGGRSIDSYLELKRFVADRPGHDQRYAIDASKIRRELDWKPRHTFVDGLRDTIRWYLAHGDWCDAVQREDSRRRLGLDAAGGGADASGESPS